MSQRVKNKFFTPVLNSELHGSQKRYSQNEHFFGILYLYGLLLMIDLITIIILATANINSLRHFLVYGKLTLAYLKYI